MMLASDVHTWCHFNIVRGESNSLYCSQRGMARNSLGSTSTRDMKVCFGSSYVTFRKRVLKILRLKRYCSNHNTIKRTTLTSE